MEQGCEQAAEVVALPDWGHTATCQAACGCGLPSPRSVAKRLGLQIAPDSEFLQAVPACTDAECSQPQTKKMRATTPSTLCSMGPLKRPAIDDCGINTQLRSSTSCCTSGPSPTNSMGTVAVVAPTSAIDATAFQDMNPYTLVRDVEGCCDISVVRVGGCCLLPVASAEEDQDKVPGLPIRRMASDTEQHQPTSLSNPAPGGSLRGLQGSRPASEQGHSSWRRQVGNTLVPDLPLQREEEPQQELQNERFLRAEAEASLATSWAELAEARARVAALEEELQNLRDGTGEVAPRRRSRDAAVNMVSIFTNFLHRHLRDEPSSSGHVDTSQTANVINARYSSTSSSGVEGEDAARLRETVMDLQEDNARLLELLDEREAQRKADAATMQALEKRVAAATSQAGSWRKLYLGQVQKDK
mmetsp:Transcript_9992/g.28698  ORF Transcript_9992/g.28698 Transcript_9992/m.28698 type:complete len:415 (-) Transcript_9992:38-1282(-)